MIGAEDATPAGQVRPRRPRGKRVKSEIQRLRFKIATKFTKTAKSLNLCYFIGIHKRLTLKPYIKLLDSSAQINRMQPYYNENKFRRE